MSRESPLAKSKLPPLPSFKEKILSIFIGIVLIAWFIFPLRLGHQMAIDFNNRYENLYEHTDKVILNIFETYSHRTRGDTYVSMKYVGIIDGTISFVDINIGGWKAYAYNWFVPFNTTIQFDRCTLKFISANPQKVHLEATYPPQKKFVNPIYSALNVQFALTGMYILYISCTSYFIWYLMESIFRKRINVGEFGRSMLFGGLMVGFTFLLFSGALISTFFWD